MKRQERLKPADTVTYGLNMPRFSKAFVSVVNVRQKPNASDAKQKAGRGKAATCGRRRIVRRVIHTKATISFLNGMDAIVYAEPAKRRLRLNVNAGTANA